MPVNQIVALAAAVLAVVLLVRWVRSRSSRAPDLTMHRFSRALDAIAPGGEDAAPADADAAAPTHADPPVRSNVSTGAPPPTDESTDRTDA